MKNKKVIKALSQNVIRKMLSHAEAEHPNECCGLLSGTDGEVSKVYKLTNILKSPTRYQVDATEQFAAIQEMRKEKQELLAVFHSHPDTRAYPSKTDIELAYYPEIEYIIISLADINQPVLKRFRIIDEIITEITQ